jgi:imidazoleglycerol-phosphate dehydratase
MLSKPVTHHRKTKETDIHCVLGFPAAHEEAVCKVSTGIGFLDHMLEAFSRHGHFHLELTCEGDLHIDQHHTVEDVGITLGQVFDVALGDRKGIERFGMMECPLDEALVKAVIDISGRSYLHYGLRFLAGLWPMPNGRCTSIASGAKTTTTLPRLPLKPLRGPQKKPSLPQA